MGSSQNGSGQYPSSWDDPADPNAEDAGFYDPDEDPFDPDQYANDRPQHDYDTPPPAAKYMGVVQQWSIDGPGPSGYKYLKLALAIQDAGKWANRWVWDICSFSPNSGQRWASLLKALGWRKEYGAVQRTEEGLTPYLDSGIAIPFKTKVETNRNGKREARVAYYAAPQEEGAQQAGPVQQAGPQTRQGAPQGAPEQEVQAPPASREEAMQRARGTLQQATGQQAQQRPPQRQQPAGGWPGDDDLPF